VDHVVFLLEQGDGGCCERFLGDRRPMIHDRLGDRQVLTLGLPGHGRPRVAPRRTDSVGRPKALERPAKLLPFPAALSRDRPASVWGTRLYSSFANLLPLYNTRMPPQYNSHR